MIIGIVGEICSGKSTVADILKKKRDYFYINADEIGHFIIEPDGKAYNEIIEYFGDGILNNDKTINRKKLGDIVFSDGNLLQKLNDITHKYIYNEIRMILNHLRYQTMFEPEINIIIDAALLYEIRLDSLVDEVWYIESDKNIRLQRLMARNNYTYDEAISRIEAQQISRHKEKADHVIINNDNIDSVEHQIDDILSKKQK